MSLVHLAVAVPQIATAAVDTAVKAGGVLDWATGKANATMITVRAIATVAAVIFVVYHGIKSHGAMARIIMSGLAAAVFLWLVFNVTSLQSKVGSEVNTNGMGAVTLVTPAAPHA